MKGKALERYPERTQAHLHLHSEDCRAPEHPEEPRLLYKQRRVSKLETIEKRVHPDKFRQTEKDAARVSMEEGNEERGFGRGEVRKREGVLAIARGSERRASLNLLRALDGATAPGCEEEAHLPSYVWMPDLGLELHRRGFGGIRSRNRDRELKCAT